jgi:hypothetical protein
MRAARRWTVLARGDAGVVSNPVPRGMAGRRPGRRGRGGVRLVRTPRTLPRVLSPSDVPTSAAPTTKYLIPHDHYLLP